MLVFAEKFILPVCSGALLLLMLANPMHWDWTPRIWGAVIALGIAALAALLITRQARKKEPRATEEKPGRIYVPSEVTMESLLNRFDDPNQTSLQARKSMELFVGKWVRYTGKIDNVLRHGIFFAPLTGHRLGGKVIASFDNQWDEHLAILPRGQLITVAGQIEEVDAISVHLRNCELIETLDSQKK